MIADISLEVVIAASTFLEVASIIFEQMVIDIAAVVVVVHIIIFGCIAVIEDLISCDSPVDYKNLTDYASLMTQKVAIEAIVVLIAEGVTALDKRFGLIVPMVY